MSTTNRSDSAVLMKKALQEIRDLRAKVDTLEHGKTAPIAVIGLACRFPGADGPDAFWDLLSRGVDAITEIPRDRWDVDAYFDPNPEAPGKMYTRWGGFLTEIDKFSPAFFGIAPREAASMDPQQRLLLEVSWQALENAGAPPQRLASRQVGVFIGIGATDYGELEVMQGPGAIDPYNGTGSSHSVAAGRLSYLLGVRGPSLAVDTACSSSLASLHLAVNSLRSGESDVALAGGVNLTLSPDSLVTLCKARMLSPDGRCKTFDASANGYVRGEGCGVLVLKRLADALAEGDNILALIRGSAVNHNGRSGGLTVPSGPAQEELIRHALESAGLTPRDVAYVEAHGTGTAVGDPIEVNALANVYGDRSRPLLIGSVKSNVGHLEWAAGVCGVIKAILAIRHRQIPASLHVRTLNPHLDWKNLPVRVVTELTPWPEGSHIAGVSSFGFGGTNAHVLVEAPPEPSRSTSECERPLHIFTASAKSPEALAELTARYEPVVADREIADACFTANTGRNHWEHRIAVIASSSRELRGQLRSATPARVPAERSRIAMLFTGQGSQYPGMGRELLETQPVFSRALKRCDEILRSLLDRSLLEILYPRDPAAPDQPIHQTAYTQPALFALEFALAEVWRSWGIRPDAVLGHSVGEYVAACIAGVFSLEDGLHLIAARGRLMQSLPRNGAMAAVRAGEDRVAPYLERYKDSVSFAAINGPGDVAISGECDAVGAIETQLKAAGIASQRLTVSHAFHSPLMEPILAEFEREVRAIRLSPPQVPLISNVTGRPVSDEVTDPGYWVRHLREPVRFRASMEELADHSVFLEAGPQPVLLGLGRQSLPQSSAAWLPSLSHRRGNWQQMLESLSALYLRGADIDWPGFDRGYARRKLELPAYPFERQRYSLPKPFAKGRSEQGSLRPLVDSVVQSPAVEQTILTTRLGIDVYPYLGDHRVFGETVAPAACYIAMLLNGASALGRETCGLEDVFFVAPLVLPGAAERTLQAIVEPDSSFQIVSFAAGTAREEASKHVTGRFAPEANPPATAGASLEQAQARCATPLDPEWVSAGVEGIEFGPSFRWIDAIWAGESETLARLRVPEAIDNAKDYWLHPGLLDACFQSAEATLGDDVELPLPFGVQSLWARKAGTGPVWWTHARQVGPFTWNIRLFDASGAVIVAIDGFEARKATRDAFRRTSDLLYRIDWQPQTLPLDSPLAAGVRKYLIVENGGSLGPQLAENLRATGDDAALAHRADVASLLTTRGTPFASIIYVAEARAGVDPSAAAETLSVDALELTQAVTRAAASARLWFVTQGSATVLESDGASTDGLAQSALWGFIRTLVLEHPELRPGCIDLPAEPAPQDVNALTTELRAATDESQVAYRSGERYVARLVRHREPAKLARPSGAFRLQLSAYGSPDRLRLVPLDRRKPGPGEVEIEIRAAALNFRDVLISLGLLRDHYERALKIDRAEDIRLGFDCAGVISAVGEGVTDFKIGDEVMSTAAGGSASHLTLPRTDVVLKPSALGFEAASAIPTVFFTAHYGLLRLAKLKQGERVLIHAASGGVGQAAVQLAKAVGAEIFATASPGKWHALKRQGIAHVLNSRTLDFADEIMRLTGGAGVDVVLNSLTGAALDRSFDVLKPGGRFIEIGKIGILTPQQAAARRPDVTYFAFDVDEEITRDQSLVHSILGEVRAWFEAGRLEPLPQTAFPIEAAVEAYRFLQQTSHVGKVVLTLAPPPSSAPISADGSYLITGGLGGLGLEVARYLVAQGARNLVLAGRSGASDRSRESIARLEAAGASILVAQADIAKAADVNRLIASCPAPLRGVVHAAGVLDDGVLENQNVDRFARVMAPKARGAWHLHVATRSLPLDFFVCFASMASAMGAAGQINYAAANAFLDGLAQHRRSLGLCGLSIDWGPWAEVGMAAALSVAGQGVEKLGIEDGLQAFGELLGARQSGPAQIGVWRAHWPAFQKRQPQGKVPPYLSSLMRSSSAQPVRAAAQKSDLLSRLRGVPAQDRVAMLESAIRAELADVLRLDAAQEVPTLQAWADLGVDSLMMVELKNRLESALQITLPVEKLARDMDTHGLATFLVERLADASEPQDKSIEPASASPSEEFVRKLVDQIPQLFVTAEKQAGRRILAGGRWRYDFASCNYLGLDFEPEVMAAIPPALAEWGVHPSWTRAVASPKIYDDLERALAAFVGAPTTLVFPSISLLHAGVIPVLAGHDGIILKDTEAHHSLHEGCLRAQANGAEWVNFPHSDIDDLARRLAKIRPERTKIIATDGVYSMGSSHPPLIEYVRLAKAYNATLYVDDAHGFGVIGERPDAALPYGHRGNGMVRHFDLDYVRDRIIYVAGLSKAFSSYAAFVTCFDEKMKYDLQASGPYVFSGPTCTASLASALAGLRVNARDGDDRRRLIYSLTHRFVTAVREIGFEIDNGGYFPIVGVVIGDLEELVQACRIMWEHDILITPATYPAVPMHRNLVRFSITAANTEDEVDRAIEALAAVWRALHRKSEAPIDMPATAETVQA